MGAVIAQTSANVATIDVLEIQMTDIGMYLRLSVSGVEICVQYVKRRYPNPTHEWLAIGFLMFVIHSRMGLLLIGSITLWMNVLKSATMIQIALDFWTGFLWTTTKDAHGKTMKAPCNQLLNARAIITRKL